VKNSSAKRQDSTEHGPVQNEHITGTVKENSPASKVGICPRDSPVKKTDTADRENTAVGGITNKNPGAGI
jgi:hypothetical protein